MAKIETLEGQNLSGEVLIHQVAEDDAHEIQHAVILAELKDGTITAWRSNMELEKLVLLYAFLGARINKILSAEI